MTTTLPEAETRQAEPERPQLPYAISLQDRMPECLKAPRVLAGFALCTGLTYCILSCQPLWHTDVWGHLAYGKTIWQGGTIPSTEPLMPLATGVPFVDTAWLSQLISYGAHRAWGNSALQFLYAGSITLCLAMMIWRLYRRTQSAVWTLIGCGVFAWVDWQQLLIVRPQLAGLVCFVSLLVLLTGSLWTRARWIAVPVLFALWANLHGSFPAGLVVLLCFCAGRAIDVTRRTRRLAAVVHDGRVRRYFLLTQLAAVAVLVNPYGLGLYAEVLSVLGNANLDDLIEWEPLTLRMKQGQAAAAAVLALMAVYRFSPRRVSATEVLLLAGLGGLAMWTSRMILWWAPVAAYCLALHGHAAWRHMRRNRPVPEPSPRSGKWTVVAVGVIWICFAFSPFGMSLLHGKQGDSAKTVSRYTPVGAVEYLTKHPPKGQVFNTYEWGDYLLWAGPKDIQVFVASHAHLVPREVWRHYMQVIRVASGWEETLARYGVNTVVLDTARRGALIGRLRRSGEWQIDYEDGRSIIFVRKEPI